MSTEWLRKTGVLASLLLSVLLLHVEFPTGTASSPAVPGLSLTAHQTRVWVQRLAGLPAEGLAGASSAPKDEGAEVELAAGAELRIFRLQPDHSYSLVTVETVGEQPLALQLSEGAYWLIARLEGHSRLEYPLLVEGPSEHRLTLRAQRSLKVEVLAEQEGELRPLRGATVLAKRAGGLPHGRPTDGQGVARFTSLPRGPLVVEVYAPGFQPYEAVTEADLLVRLRPVRTLRVQVVGGGKPQQGARVSITGPSLWPPRTVETGPKGYIDITGLKSGQFTVAATKESLASKPERVQLTEEPGMEIVTLFLEPGTYARVLVKERDGDPIADARLTFNPDGLGQLPLRGSSAADGRVQLGPLVERRGTLLVRAEGFVGQVVPFEGEGEQVIELVRAGTVTGRVVDERGLPVAGASVEVVGTDTSGMPVAVYYRNETVADAHFDWAVTQQNTLIPAGELGVLLGPIPAIPLADVAPDSSRKLTTDDKGRFFVTDVPPGNLIVLARHPAHISGASKPFSLGSGGQAEVDVTLGEGRPLRGRILDHRGFPVDQVRVRVSGERFERQVAVESDGTFELDAAPNVVRLRVSAVDQPLRVLVEHRVTQKQRDEEVQVTLPEPRGSSHLSIVDQAGAPLGLAQVQLTSLDEKVPMWTTRFSDADGELEFEGVKGLSVRLRVEAPGHVARTLSKRMPAELTVSLSPALKVQGRVLGVRGRHPAAGAKVELAIGDVTRRSVADEFGVYHLAGVPAGAGRLSAHHDDYGTAEIRVKVAPGLRGRDIELDDLILSPPLKVEGIVQDAAGQPVSGAWVGRQRIGAYLRADARPAARSDAAGRFVLELEGEELSYLYGMKPGVSYGFSDQITAAEGAETIDGVTVILDRDDPISPDARATVLIAIEPQGGQLLIYAVASRSEAARAGLRQGDLILQVEGEDVDEVERARELMSGSPGTDVSVAVLRAGSEKLIRVRREPFLR